MSAHDDLNGLEHKISIRGYFERILTERERATELAESEREKAAEQVRNALEAQMKSGDERLEDHITHQVEQVHQGLAALNALLSEKDARLEDRWDASQKAVDKAEGTLNKRLEGFPGTYQTQENAEAEYQRLVALIERNREDIIDTRSQSDKFQYRLIGMGVLAMVVVPLIVAIIVYLLTRHSIPINPL